MRYKLHIFFILLIVSSNSYTQDEQRGALENLESLVGRFDEKQVVRNKNGWFHYFIPKGMADTLTVKMSCVFEGIQTHPPHIHNEDEAFYIVKGPVRFHINNEERILKTGDLIYTPSGSSHNIQRINDDTIKYLVIKREWLTDLATPYKVGKTNYIFEDCYFPTEIYGNSSREITLLRKNFSDGFKITMNKISKAEAITNNNDLASPQTAIYILEGETEVIFNGQKTVIKENNTFYCPKGGQYALSNIGNDTLILLSITTE